MMALAVVVARPAAPATAAALPDRGSDPAGTLVDWGANPGVTPSLTDVVDVAGRDGNDYAIRADGTVVALSGTFYYDQPPAGLHDVVDLSVAFDSVAALRADGSILTWGGRLSGPNSYGTDNIGVAAGMGWTLALKSDHTVRAAGADNTGQTDVPAGLKNVTAVAASSSPGVSGTSCGFSLALKSDGTVVGWGGASYAGCGHYDDVRVQPPAGLTGVVAISAGSDYALALKSDGTVVGWGSPTQPAAVVPADLRNVVKISAGSGQALALRADGTVVTWGSASESPPGNLTGVTTIAAGDYNHRLAVRVPTTVGSPVLQTRIDTNAGGTAEAFRYTAARSGTVTSLDLYLDASNTAGRVQVGLYDAAGVNPSALLTTGTISSPVAGGWNRVTVPATSLTAGRGYWLAVLAPRGAGKIKFRDRPDGSGGATQTSAQTSLTELPATWRPGQSFANAPASFFAGPTG